MALNIVLVEPEIPQNTGNIARTCAATGARLHLVGPMGFAIDDRKLKRAGLDDFLLSHTADADKFFFFTTKGKHIHSDLQYPEDAYLFFGKETKGLPEWLLHEHPDVCARLPMRNDSRARSLNLSNTVAVAVYEVLRQWGYPELLCEGHLREYDD